MIVPGIGAHRTATIALFLAETAWEQGYSVVVIASPFNWEFIAHALTSPFPGYTPRDAEDVYAALTAVRADLEQRRPGQLGANTLMGYSLGGIQTLHIAGGQDARGEGALHFERFVAINPPVDLQYSFDAFDAFFDAPLRWPEDERQERALGVAMKAFRMTQRGDSEYDPEVLPFTRTESEFLIGLVGRATIIDTLFAVKAQGQAGLALPEDEDGFVALINRSSMESYANELVVPYVESKTGLDRDALFEKAGMRPFAAILGSGDVRVLHNADDFILGAPGLEFLERAAGDRLALFPGGGHMGNLHEPEVRDAVLEALGPIVERAA